MFTASGSKLQKSSDHKRISGMEDRFHATLFYYLVMLEVKMGFFCDYFMSPNYRTTGCTGSSYFLISSLHVTVLKILPELRNLFPSAQLQNEREDLCSGAWQQDRSSGSSCRKEVVWEERRVPGPKMEGREGLGYQPAVVMKVKEERAHLFRWGLVEW